MGSITNLKRSNWLPVWLRPGNYTHNRWNTPDPSKFYIIIIEGNFTGKHLMPSLSNLDVDLEKHRSRQPMYVDRCQSQQNGDQNATSLFSWVQANSQKVKSDSNRSSKKNGRCGFHPLYRRKKGGSSSKNFWNIQIFLYFFLSCRWLSPFLFLFFPRRNLAQ